MNTNLFYESFENEELKRHKALSSLNITVNEVRVTIDENIRYDGNCNTILKLLLHLSHDASSLRSTLQVHLTSFTCPNTLLDIQFLADLCGPFTEIFVYVVVTSPMLECNTTIYTVTPQNNKAIHRIQLKVTIHLRNACAPQHNDNAAGPDMHNKMTIAIYHPISHLKICALTQPAMIPT